MIRIFNPRNRMRNFWRLEKGTYIIGRDKNCDLFIDDNTISRKHARLEVFDDDSATITDLGSRNGVVVNTELKSGTVKLSHNDVIELGRIELLMKIGSDNHSNNTSMSMINLGNDLTSATIMPINEALKPLPPKILENPAIFNAISEIGKMLVVPGQDRDMFNKSLKSLQDVIPLERAAIFLMNELEGDICVSSGSISTTDDSGSFCISRTILRELLNNKTAILIGDSQAESKYAEQQSIIMAGIKSAIAVPLYDEGQVFGILYADTTNPAHRYTENHLRIIATFGNMLAAKMANNSLLKERREKERLESELAAASEIQKQLLPKSLPSFEKYSLYAYQSQCIQVGGDLYDISKLDDENILIMLADVSGKGMGAALLASNILAALRTLYNSKNFDMLESIRAVSEQLLHFSRMGDFATLFLAVLNPASGSIRYLNAGHNPPVLIRSDGSIKYLEASGVPIGIMDSAEWKVEKEEINTGEILFIFTDGIPEANNQEGEMFGDDRLVNFIIEKRNCSPETLGNSVIGEIDKFTGDFPKSDDITLIALRRDD